MYSTRCHGEVPRAPDEAVSLELWTYVNPASRTHLRWSLDVAQAYKKGLSCARKLREWLQDWIVHREDLAVNPYDQWNESLLDRDSDDCTSGLGKSENTSNGGACRFKLSVLQM
jgi:hypothetical protein